MSDKCNGCSVKAELAHVRMYAPARRATRNAEPVKAIGKCNTAYWFGLQLADEHFEDSGRPYTEVQDEA